MKIVESSDKKHVEVIRNALEKNDGYCPCSLVKSEDTKCMCKSFRDQNTPGACHCGLYEKVEEKN